METTKTTQSETYAEMERRHQNDVNTFEGLFFAFSDKQLMEGLIKVGLTANDTDKIVHIGAGGFLRKDRRDSWWSMLERHTAEKKAFRKANKQIKIKFVGVDYWGKANFRTLAKPYYYFGSLYELFSDDATEEEVLKKVDEDEMVYFGNSFGCEPMGTPSGNIKIVKNN